MGEGAEAEPFRAHSAWHTEEPTVLPADLRQVVAVSHTLVRHV